MDFLVCLKGCGIKRMLQIDIPLTDVEDRTEAISKAREIAIAKEEGTMVALFTRDAEPICGWKVMEGDELKDEPIGVIQDRFNVSPENFKLAKRQKDALVAHKTRQSKH